MSKWRTMKIEMIQMADNENVKIEKGNKNLKI